MYIEIEMNVTRSDYLSISKRKKTYTAPYIALRLILSHMQFTKVKASHGYPRG